MCAINGFFNAAVEDASFIRKMNEANAFRGPDYTSIWQDERISLGHNLLAVNDSPEKSYQPRVSKRGNILVYNGQIYGTSYLDTDYLCDMLDYHGVDYLKNVSGQFALAWYEPEKNRLTIARDHFGGKPLFYIEGEDGVIFSSTLHALHCYRPLKIDGYYIKLLQSLNRFHIGDHCLYSKVKKLVPGEYRTYDTNSGRLVSSGSLHDYQLERQMLTDKEVKSLISDCVTESISNDNRTGVFLSGGLDSNTILHHCAEELEDVVATSCSYLETNGGNIEERYTIDVEKAIQCARFFGVDHYLSNTSPDDLEESMEEILSALFLPTFDMFRIGPRFFASQTAKEAGCKVVLSGDGGDEIFTGYSGDLIYNIPNYKRELQSFYSYINERYPNLPLHVFGPDDINNDRFFMLVTRDSFSLVNDAFAGWHSMEARQPFLHQRLVREILNIPGKLKLRRANFQQRPENTDKYYLRKLFEDELPFCVTHSPIKSGFAAPWDSRNEKKNKRVFLTMISRMQGILKNDIRWL